ncbi:MAG: L,D-transpeptidase [Bacillota bacterium]
MNKFTYTLIAVLTSANISSASLTSPTANTPELPSETPVVVATEATSPTATAEVTPNESNQMDELDPFDPNIEQKLDEMDKTYEEQTGLPSFMDDFIFISSGCTRIECAVWAQVSKSRQKLYLYVDGKLTATWPVSTGDVNHATPNFDKHPNGRIYDSYTSAKYPGGDYKGLGNMPYAVFISGGFAIHGTGSGNWKKLGTAASHGCIRIHPDNALYFNRLVRSKGINDVWITVQD